MKSCKTYHERSDFYCALRKAREEKGLPNFGSLKIPDHPLINQPLDNEGHIVEEAFVQWWDGCYILTLVYVRNGSHGTRATGRWKQIYDLDAIKARAKAITTTDRVSLYDEEDHEN